jgi:hypothetical protein
VVYSRVLRENRLKLASKLFVASIFVLIPNAAFASGFSDSKATVVANGMTCKKTTVQFTPAKEGVNSGKIVVSGGKGKCKKIGFAKKIGDLTDLTWDDKSRSVDFTLEGGSTYTITIKNKANYRSMRQALIDAI